MYIYGYIVFFASLWQGSEIHQNLSHLYVELLASTVVTLEELRVAFKYS